MSERSWLERLNHLLNRAPQTREQLMTILRNAEERDLLSPELLSMIERILMVSELQVRDVMVPKAQIVALNKDSTLESLLPIVIESGHSRFPVLDPTGKDVVGILLAKDLLQHLGGTDKSKKPFSLVETMRPARFTSQSKRLDILLREFRTTRNHLVVVLDEYGHFAGLVTIEDVLEQIVGEIEDEYDIDEEDTSIKKLDETTYIVKAATLIEEFNAYFASSFSEDEFDTIGGIVLQAFGHLPKRGEVIKLHNFRFKVLNCDHRRLYLLEVKVAKTKKDSKAK
jgi:magnesium and cobalt transporter